MRHITFDPLMPLALWAPLALAAVLLVVVYALAAWRRLAGLRRMVVLGLMAIGLALPLIILLNPIWVEEVPPPAGKPRLTILVDASASMDTADAGESQTRYQAACQIARRAADQLQARFDVRVRAFDAGSSVASLEDLGARQPDGGSTDLAEAIEASLDDVPQRQALLVLSDGIHNTGGGVQRVRQSVEKARAMATPIYTTTLGGPGSVQDLEVSLSLPQELAFVGQQVPVTVSLTQRGSIAASARLVALLDDEVVEERDVPLVSDGMVQTVFQVSRDEAGLYRYQYRAEPLPGEVTPVNNSATLLLRVVDDPVQVLLLEGKPYWDTKFLLRTLASDQSIELTSIVRMAEGRFLQRKVSSPTPPAREAEPPPSQEDAPPQVSRSADWSVHSSPQQILADPARLAAYQIVVLGRDAEVYLTDDALIQLKKWLIAGDGSLVCFRGPPASQTSQRLGELMPVRWTGGRESRFRVRLTEPGQSMHWLPSPGDDQDLLANLPSLASVAADPQPKPLAVVLATGEGAEQQAPVIAYQPMGNGRVVVVEGAGMWRWAFLPPQYQTYDDVYGQLWRSLLRWLVAGAGLLPSQQVALRSDKVTFSTTETAAGTLLLREGQAGVPLVRLTGESLPAPQSITPLPVGASPGQYRVVFGCLPEGTYRAQVEGYEADQTAAAAVFDVRGNLRERLEVSARPDLMRMIAEQSGGAALEGDSPAELARRFDEHLSVNMPKRIARTTAWDRWWVMAAVLGLWGTTWGLRRWSGLV